LRKTKTTLILLTVVEGTGQGYKEERRGRDFGNETIGGEARWGWNDDKPSTKTR